MKSKPILIVPGEPKSIFFEIFFKSIKRKKFKSPLIIITSVRLLKSEMKKNNFRKKINLIEVSKINHISLNNFSLNVINVEKKPKLDNKYITDCFNAAFDLIKSGFTNKLINGPINKEKFLKKKFLGITEYISQKFNTKKTAMLIFNKKLSVCPATTHIPIKFVSKKIKKETIKEKIVQIDKFFKKYLNLKIIQYFLKSNVGNDLIPFFRVLPHPSDIFLKYKSFLSIRISFEILNLFF